MIKFPFYIDNGSSNSSLSTNRDGIGLDSSFFYLDQLVMDSKGFIYLVDSYTIRRISPQLEVKTIATIEGTFFNIPFLFEHFDLDNRFFPFWNCIG
jgi:hypothetical protein